MQPVIQSALRDKHLLLVLDNCEHVVESAPEVGKLLSVCREVHILATSRTPLHLARERSGEERHPAWMRR